MSWILLDSPRSSWNIVEYRRILSIFFGFFAEFFQILSNYFRILLNSLEFFSIICFIFIFLEFGANLSKFGRIILSSFLGFFQIRWNSSRILSYTFRYVQMFLNSLEFSWILSTCFVRSRMFSYSYRFCRILSDYFRILLDSFGFFRSRWNFFGFYHVHFPWNFSGC